MWVARRGAAPGGRTPSPPNRRCNPLPSGDTRVHPKALGPPAPAAHVRGPTLVGQGHTHRRRALSEVQCPVPAASTSTLEYNQIQGSGLLEMLPTMSPRRGVGVGVCLPFHHRCSDLGHVLAADRKTHACSRFEALRGPKNGVGLCRPRAGMIRFQSLDLRPPALGAIRPNWSYITAVLRAPSDCVPPISG